VRKRTSALSTSRILSLAKGPALSKSPLLFSNDHIETRLFVTLCEADCTFHSPIVKGGVKAGGAIDALEFAAGVEDLLLMLGEPIL
jgi:hypothetical protein